MLFIYDSWQIYNGQRKCITRWLNHKFSPSGYGTTLTLHYPLNNVIYCSFLPGQKYSHGAPLCSIYRLHLKSPSSLRHIYFSLTVMHPGSIQHGPCKAEMDSKRRLGFKPHKWYMCSGLSANGIQEVSNFVACESGVKSILGASERGESCNGFDLSKTLITFFIMILTWSVCR